MLPGFISGTAWGVAYSNGYWIAVGDSGKYCISTNTGGGWTSATVITGWNASYPILDIDAAGSIWSAVGGNAQQAYTLNNGTTWATQTIASWGAYPIEYVMNTPTNVWVAVGQGAGGAQYVVSTGGIIWGAPQAFTGWTSTGAVAYSIAFGNSTFIAAGANNIGAYAVSVSAGLSIIPLKWQSAFFALPNQKTFSLTRVVGRLYCFNGATSTINLTWNYVTVDGSVSGQVTGTVTTSVQDSNGVAIFDWAPPSGLCLAGSLGISTTDTVQKLVLLSADLYYKPDAEVTISNHAY